jgi:HAD superfamily hydrolase (TIGR01509 family)
VSGVRDQKDAATPPVDRRWDFPWHYAPPARPLGQSTPLAPLPPAGVVTPTAVLFDIGLTFIHPCGDIMLADTIAEAPDFDAPAHHLAALLLAAEARHLPLPHDADGDTKVALAWGALLGLAPEQARGVWRRMMARQDLYCELDPDAEDVLQGLRGLGIRVAAVSNSDGTLRPELRHFGLDRYFDAVVDSTAVSAEKPAPAIYRVAVDALGVAADTCWFVGDGLVNDVLGARRAGVGCSVLYDRLGLYTHLPAVARIGRLTHLLRWLDSGSAAHPL